MRENRTYGLTRGHVRNYVPDGSTLLVFLNGRVTLGFG